MMPVGCILRVFRRASVKGGYWASSACVSFRRLSDSNPPSQSPASVVPSAAADHSSPLSSPPPQPDNAVTSLRERFAMTYNDPQRRELMKEAARECSINTQERLDKKIKSFSLRRDNVDEHPLLADLDMDKDAHVFGNDPQTFYENVEKMKNVIVAYTKWERDDNRYKVARWIIWGCICYVVVDLYTVTKQNAFLQRSYPNFLIATSETLDEIPRKRARDFARVVELLDLHPPNFDEVVATQRKESSAATKSMEDSPMDTAHQAAKERSEKEKEMRRLMEKLGSVAPVTRAVSVDDGQQDKPKWRFWGKAETKAANSESKRVHRYSYATNPVNIATVRQVRRIVLPESEDYSRIVQESMVEYAAQKYNLLKFPK